MGICAAVAIQCGSEVLLLQRGITAPWMPLKWNLPGGVGEEGEAPEQVAIRECVQETGYTPTNLVPIGTINQDGFVIHYFKERVETKPEIVRCWENCAEKWVNPSEVREEELIPGVFDAIKSL